MRSEQKKLEVPSFFVNDIFFCLLVDKRNQKKQIPNFNVRLFNLMALVASSNVATSDESEPSWLEPELELKDFQLVSARDLFLLSLKSKIGRKVSFM